MMISGIGLVILELEGIGLEEEELLSMWGHIEIVISTINLP